METIYMQLTRIAKRMLMKYKETKSYCIIERESMKNSNKKKQTLIEFWLYLKSSTAYFIEKYRISDHFKIAMFWHNNITNSYFICKIDCVLHECKEIYLQTNYLESRYTEEY